MNTVKERLKDYRRKMGRLKYLKQRKEEIEGQLKEIPDSVKYYNMADIIEYNPPTNKINRIIEEAGIKSAEIHKDLQSSLNIIISQIVELEREAKIVDAIITGLTDRERFVIDKIYFCGLRLYCIPSLFYENFKETVSPKTIKRISEEATEKMEGLIK